MEPALALFTTEVLAAIIWFLADAISLCAWVCRCVHKWKLSPPFSLSFTHTRGSNRDGGKGHTNRPPTPSPKYNHLPTCSFHPPTVSHPHTHPTH